MTSIPSKPRVTNDFGHDRNRDRDDVSGSGTEGSPLLIPYRSFTAPKRNGEALVEPPLDRVEELVRSNLALQAGDSDAFGSLRSRARKQLINDALTYTGAYRDTQWAEHYVREAESERGLPTIFMAGHQPTLFHPGVWFKNFALSHLGEAHRALSINLVIDNDVAAGCSIRVPSVLDSPSEQSSQSELSSLSESGSLSDLAGRRRVSGPTRVAVRYDEASGGVPHEQTTINDQQTFGRFDQAVQQVVKGIVDHASVMPLWKHARSAVARCGVAGCALAQARHGLEGEIGLRTLELPISVLCRGSAFAEFVLMILAELPHFQVCYNEEADRYRRAHGIRSTAHPVPNLAEQEGWFEAPLWIYGNDSPQRKAAWVKLSGDELVISDRPLVSDAASGAIESRALPKQVKINVRHPKLAAEQLANLIGPHFKLRPRALITTMYARLVLSDLFLHGIGGAKYDQLGDQIMQRFFGVSAPAFMVTSATVQLPGLRLRDFDGEIRRLERRIRDSVYQPETFVDDASLNADWVSKKRELLRSIPVGGPDQAWQNQVNEVNSLLAAELVDTRAELRERLAETRRAATAQSLMASREHPFCVYPLDYLVEIYRKLLPGLRLHPEWASDSI